MIALLIAYPLAYAIAFRAGRWKNAMLFAIVAPFFTTYLIRTLAWETILSDQSPVVHALRSVGLVGDNTGVLATSTAVIAGITYNFLPFMVLPIYASLERIDERLLEAAKDLYASPAKAFRRVTLPLSAPGVVAGTLLTFIPAVGDYVNAFFLGCTEQPHDRQHDPGALPDAARLSRGRGALLRADGGDHGRRLHLPPVRRVGGPDGRGGEMPA